MNLAMQGNDNFEEKSPEGRMSQSPYRIPAEQSRDADKVEPGEPVIDVTTRIRYMMEDIYDTVGDAGTTAWKYTPMGLVQDMMGSVAQFFSGGRYIHDSNPPTRAQIREVSRRMEQVGTKEYIKELNRAYGIDK